MSRYREQVESALRAVAVTSATSYTWFGRRSRRLPPAVAAALAPAAAREFLIGGLENELYQWFYTQGRPVPVGAKDGARRLDRALVEALSRVNSGAGGWEPGWRVERRQRGTAVIVRDGLRARVPVSQCREGGRRLVPGASVSVRRPKETLAGSPGFYTALGDTEPSAGRTEVRVYFNITVEGATPLVDTGTRVLNRARIPFDLKVVGDPGGFDRCDAAVLYLDDGDFERARESLRTLVSTCRQHLNGEPPAFAKPLAPGVAVGEHRPSLGASFGMSRCRLVAEGLVDAHESGARRLEDRVGAVARRFAERGLDVDVPYLAPGSQDRYEL
jgi:HopA1 effector protein family